MGRATWSLTGGCRGFSWQHRRKMIGKIEISTRKFPGGSGRWIDTRRSPILLAALLLFAAAIPARAALGQPSHSSEIPAIQAAVGIPDSLRDAHANLLFAEPPIRAESMDSSHPAYYWIAGGAGFAAITAALFRTDQHSYLGTQRWRRESAFVRTVSPVITQLGQGTVPLAMFGGLLVYGMIDGDDRSGAAGLSGLEAFALSGLVVQVSKQLVGRERPSASHKPGGAYHAPFAYFRNRRSHSVTLFDSFPSGHTSTIFSAATILADYFPEPAVAWTAYSLATLVGVTRVIERTHWFSDCFVGAAIGIASAKLVEAFHGGTSRYSIGIAPARDGYALGIGIQL